MIPSDEEILRKRWPMLRKEKEPSNENFVFLSVDVIGHSELFRAPSREVLIQRHELLVDLRKYVRECFQKPWPKSNDLEWAWAGDGGIYAFPVRYTNVFVADKMFLVAKQMAEGLPAFNALHAADPIELRIVLDFGEGFRHPEREIRRGAPLNFVAKLRVPGERTSIAVTQELLDELSPSHRKLFRSIDAAEQTPRTVYVHLQTHEKALLAEIEATTDPMQASHLAYRLGVLYFGTSDRPNAIEQLGRAIDLIDRVDQRDRHRYYHRTMRAFYVLWKQLAEEIPDDELASGDGSDRRQMLCSLRERFFRTYRYHAAWDLLFEMEFCLEQLDILAHRPVSDPIGLTSLQICLLLERVGYPRKWHGAAISERMKRIETELEESVRWKPKEGALTIDMACGLCSAVAASCLALDANPLAASLVDWLASKKNENYSYRGKLISSRAEAYEHAMHYAATALQAFLDHDLERNRRTIDDVLEKFFKDVPENRQELPEQWMRHRNISIADYCGIVFPVFARTIMARGLEPERRRILSAALYVMANHFGDEALAGRLNHPGRLYAGRDNMGSFGLGLLVDFPLSAGPMFRGFRQGMAAVSGDILPGQQRKRTIDSNLDRIRKWLDGWLLQWECALFLRENDEPIQPFQFRDLFVTDRPVKSDSTD